MSATMTPVSSSAPVNLLERGLLRTGFPGTTEWSVPES